MKTKSKKIYNKMYLSKIIECSKLEVLKTWIAILGLVRVLLVVFNNISSKILYAIAILLLLPYVLGRIDMMSTNCLVIKN